MQIWVMTHHSAFGKTPMAFFSSVELAEERISRHLERRHHPAIALDLYVRKERDDGGVEYQHKFMGDAYVIVPAEVDSWT